MTLAAFLAGLFIGVVIPPLVFIGLVVRGLHDWGSDGWGRD